MYGIFGVLEIFSHKNLFVTILKFSFGKRSPRPLKKEEVPKLLSFFLNFSRINQTEPKIQLRDQIYQWSYEIHIMMMTMHLNA